jgi:hypothetical protein
MEERTEKEILGDLRAAQEAYAAIAADRDKSTISQTEAAAEKCKTLFRELDAYVSTGADVCKNCGKAPMGMLKTPAHTHNGAELPDLWEVGCVHCEPFLVEREDGKALVIDGKVVKVKRRSYSARGFSPAEAVKKWNAGEWVEDFYFDRMRGFTPEYAPPVET